MLNCILSVFEEELNRIEASVVCSDVLFSSIIQLLLYLFYASSDHPSVLQSAVIEQLTLSRILELLIFAVKVDDNQERKQRYQQLLSW